MIYRNTCTYGVLTTLKKYKEGLSANRLHVLASNNWSIMEHYTSVILSLNLKKGNVKIIGKRACEECGKANSIYILTRKGMKELQEADEYKKI